MAELNPQPLPPREVVRVHVPTKVAFDLEAMQRITADVLERLGCGGCHSGRVIEFLNISEFVVNANLEVEEIAVRRF